MKLKDTKTKYNTRSQTPHTRGISVFTEDRKYRRNTKIPKNPVSKTVLSTLGVIGDIIATIPRIPAAFTAEDPIRSPALNSGFCSSATRIPNIISGKHVLNAIAKTPITNGVIENTALARSAIVMIASLPPTKSIIPKAKRKMLFVALPMSLSRNCLIFAVYSLCLYKTK